MATVWILCELYATGGGPQATRIVDVYAEERVAYAILARRMADLIRADERSATTAREIYGRTHWFEGRGVRFHGAFGDGDVTAMFVAEHEVTT